MPQLRKNHDIRIKIIKLKKSFDLQIKNNRFTLSRINNQSIFSLAKPYQFPDYDQTQKHKDDKNFAQFMPQHHKSYQAKPTVRQNQFVSNQNPVRKLQNFSYKSQKSQRFIKQKMAIEDLKHIRSISINNFRQNIKKWSKIKSQIEEKSDKNENKIQKIEQKKESYLNVRQLNIKSYGKKNYRNLTKSMALKQVLNKRIKSEQSYKPETFSRAIFSSVLKNKDKSLTSQRIKNSEDKFLIDGWQVSQEFIT